MPNTMPNTSTDQGKKDNTSTPVVSVRIDQGLDRVNGYEW